MPYDWTASKSSAWVNLTKIAESKIWPKMVYLTPYTKLQSIDDQCYNTSPQHGISKSIYQQYPQYITVAFYVRYDSWSAIYGSYAKYDGFWRHFPLNPILPHLYLPYNQAVALICVNWSPLARLLLL